MHDRRGPESISVATRPHAVGAVILATALAAFLAACGTQTPTVPVQATTGPSTPAITIAPTAEPPSAAPPTSVAPTAAAGSPACTAADLKASHGLVEGAAGSRITEVVLVTSTACSIDAFPTLGLRDANGAAIVGGTAAGAGTIDVSPAQSYTSEVRVANWCGAEPAFPVSIELRLGADEVAVTGSSFPEEGNLPPCNGGGAPVLEAGAWTPGS